MGRPGQSARCPHDRLRHGSRTLDRSLLELLQGARSKLEVRQIQQSLRQLQFRILPLSEPIGATSAALIEQHAMADGIQLADALIAATALESALPLCTGNIKHFRPIRALSRVAFRP